jgi:hypothetical protein
VGGKGCLQKRVAGEGDVVDSWEVFAGLWVARLGGSLAKTNFDQVQSCVVLN